MDINVNGNASIKKTATLGFVSGLASALGLAAGAILGFKALDWSLSDEKTSHPAKEN